MLAGSMEDNGIPTGTTTIGQIHIDQLRRFYIWYADQGYKDHDSPA